MSAKTTFLDKLLGRLDRVDPQSLQSVLLKLAREKGFLETLFNTIEEGILVTDPTGHIYYVNAAAAHLLGFSPDTATGRPLTDFLTDLKWDELWSTPPRDQRRIISRELEIAWPQHRILSLYVVPIAEDPTAAPTHLAVIVRDITEQQARTATTIESEKLQVLTLLAAGVAHELGNPLNSLHIHLQLIERELKHLPAEPAARIRDNLRVAREEITRLDNIINRFLRAIRPTRPNFEPTDPHDPLTETLQLLEHEITARGVLLERDLAPEAPQLLLDRDQIKQALYNLIRNALQAMSAGGILHISTSSTDTHFTYTIRDNGTGIAPENIQRIFQPYFTTKPNGTGLGLMIVQRIVREHGGQLELDTAPGRGTTVRIHLPLQEKRIRLLQPAPNPSAVAPNSNSLPNDHAAANQA